MWRFASAVRLILTQPIHLMLYNIQIDIARYLNYSALHQL